jgi:hypothetical protein
MGRHGVGSKSGESRMTFTINTNAVIKAAKGWKSWGRVAATAFCKNQNIDPRLVRLARQLEAAKKGGF